MTFFKENLKNIKAFIFDVDGVLSKEATPLTEEGEPSRTTNVKDGYAIRNASNMGYPIGLITAGYVERVKLRHEKLGIKHIYMGVHDKLAALTDFIEKTGVKKEEILFMGDDYPDFPVLKAVGIPVCPIDAAPDIKEICVYISEKKGGEGCVRDIIEQVMRAQGTWTNENSFYWKSS